VKLLNRKSRLQRLLESVNDSLNVRSGIATSLPSRGSGHTLKGALPNGKDLKAAVPKDKALKAGLIASGVAGLTAGSAGISSLRRRTEGATDDS
jgi:hypothetical protein